MAMNLETSSAVGLTMLIMFEIPNLYSGLLPSQFTISTFTGSSPEKKAHTKKMIRFSEMQATALAVGLAVGGSLVTKTPWPILGSLAMIAWLIWQYEYALRSGTDSGPSMDMDNYEQNTAEPTSARYV